MSGDTSGRKGESGGIEMITTGAAAGIRIGAMTGVMTGTGEGPGGAGNPPSTAA